MRVDGAFTTQSWCDGVRAGRTFVSNGPMLSLSVNGREIGDEIAAQAGDIAPHRGGGRLAVPLDRIELIVNGEVVVAAAVEGDCDGG